MSNEAALSAAALDASMKPDRANWARHAYEAMNADTKALVRALYPLRASKAALRAYWQQHAPKTLMVWEATVIASVVRELPENWEAPSC